MFTQPPLDTLVESLSDTSRSIGERMRAVYYMKTAYNSAAKSPNSSNSADINLILSTLSTNLSNRTHGKLLLHEVAYVMGQLKDYNCLRPLADCLDDPDQDCIARHEAAEAIGAIIGAPDPLATHAVEVLKKNESNPAELVEVRETCRIALDFISWKQSSTSSDENTAPMACACMLSSYDSTDPAPPHPMHESVSHEEIGFSMRDENTPLFQRYRCMFSLRNKGGSEAAIQLGRALVEDESSALFRHELAFVLGQLQHKDGLEYLVKSLERENEHEFVRHESAEAIGAIDGDWEACEEILKRFLNDRELIVRQSCEVALDAMDYFRVFKQNDEEGEDEDKDDVDSFAKIKNESTVTSHFNIAGKQS